MRPSSLFLPLPSSPAFAYARFLPPAAFFLLECSAPSAERGSLCAARSWLTSAWAAERALMYPRRLLPASTRMVGGILVRWQGILFPDQDRLSLVYFLTVAIQASRAMARFRTSRHWRNKSWPAASPSRRTWATFFRGTPSDSDWFIDWLIDWLIGWLIDWLIDWLMDWMLFVINCAQIIPPRTNARGYTCDSLISFHQLYFFV